MTKRVFNMLDLIGMNLTCTAMLAGGRVALAIGLLLWAIGFLSPREADNVSPQ